MSGIEHYMDYQYWTHYDLFPHCVHVDEENLAKLCSILTYSQIGLVFVNQRFRKDSHLATIRHYNIRVVKRTLLIGGDTIHVRASRKYVE